MSWFCLESKRVSIADRDFSRKRCYTGQPSGPAPGIYAIAGLICFDLSSVYRIIHDNCLISG